MGYVKLALACIIWGIAWPLARYSVEHIGPFMTGAYRFGLALVFFLPFLYYPKRVKITLRSILFVIPLGLTGFYINNLVSYLGLQYTTATTASIIVMSNPLNIAVLSYIFLKDRLNAAGAVSIGLSMVGSLIVIVKGDFMALRNLDVNIGNLLVSMSAVCWSTYSILIKKFESEVGSIENITFGTLIATLGFLPWCFGPPPSAHVGLALAGAILFLSVCNTNLAFYFWSEGIRDANPNAAAIFFGLIPLSAAIVENMIYGEKLAGFHIIGGSLIFVGILLFIFSRRNGLKAPIPPET
jgi:drug/metabolite transporter (DMT)-like permease